MSRAVVPCLLAALALALPAAAAPAAALTNPRLVAQPSGLESQDYFGFSSCAAGDFNADGYPDVLVGAPYSNLAGIDRGAAFLFFGGPGADAVPDQFFFGAGNGDLFGYSVAGDFDLNGDGYSDIMVGSTLNDAGGPDAGRVYVYFGGPGADNIADRRFTGTAGSLQGACAAAGDVNDDGYDDVVVGARWAPGGGRADVHLGGPTVDEVADVTLTAIGANQLGYSVAGAGDVDGDGFDDVIVGVPGFGGTKGRAHLFLGGSPMNGIADVSMSFGPVSDSEFGWSVGGAGDINGDGFADWLVGGPGGANGVAALYYGSALPDSVYDVGLAGSGSAKDFGFAVRGVGDVNDDGRDDFAVGDPGYGTGAAGRLYLWYGGPGISGVAHRILESPAPGLGFGSSVARGGDFDFDGDSETVVGAWAPLSTGAAYFYDLSPETLSVARGRPTGDGPNALTAGDFDEDGILDLAIATQNSGLQILRGRGVQGIGDGRFADPTSYALAGCRDVATADFDEDGILDVLVSTGVSIVLFRGQGTGGVGDGTFVAGTAMPLTLSRELAVADFDDDGVLDFAVCRFAATSNLAVYLGNTTGGSPTGTFTALPPVTALGNTEWLLAHDFDEDGITDLALTSSTASQLGILLGQGGGGVGDGTFAPVVGHAMPGIPLGMTTGDFDEDGITDLAVASNAGLLLLRGQGAAGVGDGTFASPVQVGPGITLREVVAVDVTADGRTDLVATSANSDLVRVFAGGGTGSVGNGTFTPLLDVPSLNFVGGIVAGDFLKDGRVDFVVAGISADSISTLATDFAGGAAAMALVAPNGGNTFEPGDTVRVAWTQDPAVRVVALDHSRDGGATWQGLVPAAFEGHVDVVFGEPQTTQARVRVRDAANVPGRSDASDATFAIEFDLTASDDGGAPATAALAIAGAHPVRGKARLSLTLPRADDDVVVEAFDARGRRRATIFRGALGAGRQVLTWDASGIEPGVVFVRARGAGFVRSRPVILVD